MLQSVESSTSTMNNNLPFSQACENNKPHILAKLKTLWAGEPESTKNVLEIGSGTGQHAMHFAQNLPVIWQPSDLPNNLRSLQRQFDHAQCANIRQPIELNVENQWPNEKFDAVYTANTLHIMSWAHVQQLFKHLPAVLTAESYFIAYGPFNYDGKFTSDSNAAFDQHLRDRDPVSGIRDYEAINQLAGQAGLVLQYDVDMPANNRLLIWQVES